MILNLWEIFQKKNSLNFLIKNITFEFNGSKKIKKTLFMKEILYGIIQFLYLINNYLIIIISLFFY